MRHTLAALGWLAASATVLGQTPATTHLGEAQAWFAQLSGPHDPWSGAPNSFGGLALTNVDEALRAIRTPPLPARDRERVLATLPASGELRPRPDERKKLESLRAVLAYHQREGVIAVKLIDLPEASIGLHARTVLLISRPALALVSEGELQALAAHEIGHEFFWTEFEQASQRLDRSGRRRIELQCDGVAVLTLMALGQDPMRLTTAVRKLQRFNEGLGVLILDNYPTLKERERVVKTLLQARSPAG